MSSHLSLTFLEQLSAGPRGVVFITEFCYLRLPELMLKQ